MKTYLKTLSQVAEFKEDTVGCHIGIVLHALSCNSYVMYVEKLVFFSALCFACVNA